MAKIKALEVQITPNCIRIHGLEKTVDIALERARTVLVDCLKSVPQSTFSIEVYRLIPGPPPPKEEKTIVQEGE